MAGLIGLLPAAQALLQLVVDTAAEHDVALPERRYITAGISGAEVWDCVAVGTLINTARGPVPIEDVLVGDEVWAWRDGHMVLRPVTAAIAKGKRQTLRVKTMRRTVEVTPEHRMLIVRCSRRGNGHSNEWRTEWVRADELAQGDYVVVADRLPDVAHEQRYLSDGTALDEDVAWLLGLVVADGTVQSRSMHLCVYGDVADRAVAIIGRVWGSTPSRDKKHGLVVSGRSLCVALTDLGLNRRSTERTVPPLVLASGHKIARAFLDGYAAGDGHVASNGAIRYATANRRLAEQVRGMHMALGDVVSNLGTQERNRPIVIRGVEVRKARPLHGFRVHPDSPRRQQTVLNYRGARRALPDLHFSVDRIARVDEGPEVETYDLAVEGARSFLADGIVAHNCDQVVVGLAEFEPGLSTLPGEVPGPARVPGGAVALPSAQLRVEIVRRTPVIGEHAEMTATADEQAAGEQALTDAALLHAVRTKAMRDATLTSGEPGSVRLGPIVPAGPAGGLAGMALTVTVTLSRRPGQEQP